MNILMVMTSHDTLGNTGRKTGFWLEEFCAPYYTFLDAGANITVASPKGGEPPLDPKSDTPEGQTELTQRFKNDLKTQAVLANTTKMSDVKAQDYDAIFYPGGHGPMWDLAEDPISNALIETFYNAGKPVAGVCHGPAVLRHAMYNGEPIVKGKRVTGFTNSEEEAVNLTKVVPFLVEDELKRLGGHFEKVADWQSFAIVDGRLITGQNPASSTAAAQELIKLLDIMSDVGIRPMANQNESIETTGKTFDDLTRLSSILATQREDFLRNGSPSLQKRRDDLLKLKNAILTHLQDYKEAINADFGHRSAYETAIMEIMPTTQGIGYLHKNLRRWMRPRPRHVAMHFRPGIAKVMFQPLGVVGIISPWNYPASLCLMPLATAIAAGNRAMVKPSEYTPKTSKLMASMLKEIFPEEQVAVVTGGSDVGKAFAALPFDHLVFTGSTNVGRAVMQTASKNLVPVTLELGGKSPVIIDQDFSPARAAKSIAFGKLSNAGQTCIAPDYALIHENNVDDFVAAFDAASHIAYPTGTEDEAYSAIISQQHYDRLIALIEDARHKGAKIVEIGAAATRKLPPTVIVGATLEMTVMQQEIFGPVLPIVPYKESLTPLLSSMRTRGL